MGIFDFFKKNKKQTEISNREIQILEKPDFSKINYKKLEDYYDWKLKFGKREINLDLNFETESTNQSEFNQIIEFEEIIFATPVYWYSMSSLMKIFFDRLTDLISSQETIGRKLMGKKVRVITSSIGNHLDDNFFLPFIETANYLHLEYIDGKHYLKKNI